MMINNKVLDMAVSYKESCAFYAGMKLHLFEQLAVAPMELKLLAEKLYVDQTMLQALLRYFRLKKIVEEKDSKWHLTDDFKDEFAKKDLNIFAHELNIYERWITADSIKDSIIGGYGKRVFDIKGFSEEDKKMYVNAMYGRNVRYIAFWLKRVMNLTGPVRILEAGRSPGVIAAELKKMIPEARIGAVVSEKYSDISEKFSFNHNYDLICIFNTIHYWPDHVLKDSLEKLKQAMNQDSVLCIIDIFVDQGSSDFEKNFLLDWITHGGIYYMDAGEIQLTMEECGLTLYKTKSLKESSSLLLFFRKA